MSFYHQELNEPCEKLFTVKDPWSALTHLVGVIFAILGMPVLLIQAYLQNNTLTQMIAYTIFMLSMLVLYSASVSYHTFSVNARINKTLKKIDHCSIFYLIAGSYTPVALTIFHGQDRMILLAIVYGVALLGTGFKIWWVTCPKWVSSIMYTAMGWLCLMYVQKIFLALPLGGFLWLLSGGIFYSIGAIIYAYKKNITPRSWLGFGNHEVFHCFVLLGSFCHYIFVFQYLTHL